MSGSLQDRPAWQICATFSQCVCVLYIILPSPSCFQKKWLKRLGKTNYMHIHQNKFQVGVNLLGNKYYYSDSDSDIERSNHF